MFSKKSYNLILEFSLDRTDVKYASLKEKAMLKFSTDLRFSKKSLDMYREVNGVITRNPDLPYKYGGHRREFGTWNDAPTDAPTSVRMMNKDHDSFTWTLATMQNFDSDYYIPTVREHYAYSITPDDQHYNGYNAPYDGVKVDKHPEKERYKCFKPSNYTDSSDDAENFKTYITCYKDLVASDGTVGRVQYAMRYLDQGNERYRVVVRYYQYDGVETNSWDIHDNNTIYANLDDYLKKKTYKKKKDAYHSVTVRYLGANYGFLNEENNTNGDHYDSKIWATEAFWQNPDLNKDDIVRYYGRYGYVWNSEYHFDGLLGLYWLNYKRNVSAPHFWTDVFAVAKYGFNWRHQNDRYNLDHVSLNQVNANRYKYLGATHHYLASSPTHQEDNAPCLPVTNKGWGE